MNIIVKTTQLIGCLLLLSACATPPSYTKSSMVEYLYPQSSNKIENPMLPKLSIPLSVGIAFVPASTERNNQAADGSLWSGNFYTNPLTENIKLALMKSISGKFSQHDSFKLHRLFHRPISNHRAALLTLFNYRPCMVLTSLHSFLSIRYSLFQHRQPLKNSGH